MYTCMHCILKLSCANKTNECMQDSVDVTSKEAFLFIICQTELCVMIYKAYATAKLILFCK